MTKAIIFDLDSCLAWAEEVGEQLFAPAFAAIRAVNDGSWREGRSDAASLGVAGDAPVAGSRHLAKR